MQPLRDSPDEALGLNTLQPGDRAVVLDVQAAGALGQRLTDLGFLPGTAVRLLRRAPLGDPLSFELRGFELCLRGSEAALIRVRRA